MLTKNLFATALLALAGSVAQAQVVVNPDGTHSVVHGSVAINPDGTHSVIHGSTVINPDGTHSILVGSTIINPNGLTSHLIDDKDDNNPDFLFETNSANKKKRNEASENDQFDPDQEVAKLLLDLKTWKKHEKLQKRKERKQRKKVRRAERLDKDKQIRFK